MIQGQNLSSSIVHLLTLRFPIQAVIKHCFQAFISSHPFSPLLLFHRDSRANKSKMWQRAFILLSYLPLSSMPRILHLPFFPPLNNRSKQHPRPPIPPILPEIMVVGAKEKKNDSTESRRGQPSRIAAPFREQGNRIA